jgi:hypothetical protein
MYLCATAADPSATLPSLQHFPYCTVLYCTGAPHSESYPVWILLAGTSRSRMRALAYPSGCAAQLKISGSQPAFSELALPL